VVRDAGAWREAVERVRAHAAGLGLECLGEVESPLTGPSGNHEFFLHLRVPAATGQAAQPTPAGEPGA
jgi:predicted rRNA methylase YqxC with S4 and FtsJ domains